MTITTEEALTLAGQLDANEPMVQDQVALEFFGDVATALRSLAAERDLADEQIKGLSEERERWKDRAEKAEAEAEKLRALVPTEHRTSNRPTIERKPPNEKCPDR